MNVLRHALYKYADKGRFANQVTVSGGHLQSLEAVVNEGADLAAVDAVTYHHIAMTYPSLVAKVSIIEQTDWTVGLPFICHRDERLSTEMLLDAMNMCLQQLPENHQRAIGLNQFSEVKIQDYDKVIRIEKEAKSAGYPILN
jgi:ABC-type phosphate/phosphonate transport system substrate-binding protein